MAKNIREQLPSSLRKKAAGFLRHFRRLTSRKYWGERYTSNGKRLVYIWKHYLLPPRRVGLQNTIIHYERKCAPRRDLCLFSAFSYNNTLGDYALRYVEALSQMDMDLVYLSSSPLSKDAIDALSPFCRLIVEKENVCPDFSSWKIGLLLTDNAQNYSNILLTNDSIFGPLYDLQTVINDMNSRTLDFWGLTDSFEGEHHLQSYFLWITRKVVDSDTWNKYWHNVRSYTKKIDVCWNYEITLTSKLHNAGFRYGSYCPKDSLRLIDSFNPLREENNSILFHALFLIEKMHFPFLKRSLFGSDFIKYLEKNRAKGSLFWRYLAKWRSVIENNTSYPPQLISAEVSRMPNGMFPDCIDLESAISKLNVR